MLNLVLRRLLSMPVRDMSSGYRLYRREALQASTSNSKNFEVQQEVLVRAYARGFSVVEVPFVYFPRNTGRSHASVFRFGIDVARSALTLWKLRNSLASADYDERALLQHHPHSALLASQPPSLRRHLGTRHTPASSTPAAVPA